MTFEEFDATGFKPDMRAEHRGTAYAIMAVNFEERLLGLVDDVTHDFESMNWVRCENATILTPAQ